MGHQKQQVLSVRRGGMRWQGKKRKKEGGGQARVTLEGNVKFTFQSVNGRASGNLYRTRGGQ